MKKSPADPPVISQKIKISLKTLGTAGKYHLKASNAHIHCFNRSVIKSRYSQ